MSAKKSKADGTGAGQHRVLARNRRARHDYQLQETLECGIELQGTEVKSLREGTASLDQAFCRIEQDELWLIGANIPPYRSGSWTNHEPRRKRKLLAHRRQLRKLRQETAIPGHTLIPLELYFNEAGKVKLLLALASGKKQHDKRHALAERESKREIARSLRHG